MADIADVTRALKAVRTVGQARVVINEAIDNVDRALRSPAISAEDVALATLPIAPAVFPLKGLLESPSVARGDLERSRVELVQLKRSFSGMSSAETINFSGDSQTVIRAYVNIAGVQGEIVVQRTLSIAREVAQQAEKAASAAGELARGAVNVLDTIARMLPIILLVVLGVVVFQKTKALRS